MFTVKEYVVAESLDHAAELLGNNRHNYILGGLLWLKMGRHPINRAIDISRLGLDFITESKDAFEIGAMASLRDLETHQGLDQYFNHFLQDSVKSIVGTQFRNTATMGGSIYSRFGFSDILTALLALDTTVHLYHGGAIPLATFVNMPYTKDILIKLSIKKDQRTCRYLCQRQSATDFPIITVAVSRRQEGFNIAIGARPGRARIATATQSALGAAPTVTQIQEAMTVLAEEMPFGSNMRGQSHYRQHLAMVLTKRALFELMGLETLSWK